MTNSSYEMGLVRTAKAAVVRKGIQHVFANRLRNAGRAVQKIVIASPWITRQSDNVRNPLLRIISVIRRGNIPTYVFTRPPEGSSELDALNMLSECASVEIVYNPNLHAKLYVCVAPYPFGFAILGSANLTSRSDDLYEIGLLVLAEGGGEQIVKQLASFGLDYLRTRPDSTLVKRFSRRC